MSRSRELLACIFFIGLAHLLFPASSLGQAPQPRPQITQPINENRLATLLGNVHPLARAAFDRGSAPRDLPMDRMLLVLKRTAAQEAALQDLLISQQDKSSPNYHRWLTPAQFGEQFGPSPDDIQTVSAWLSSHGFSIDRVSSSGLFIEFSGTASQVQAAFHTEIHRFVVSGESHWANSSNPQIPAVFLPVVAGIDSLHNFPKMPLHRVAGVFTRSNSTGQTQPLQSEFTFPFQNCGNDCYFLGPYDFATIYNILPLWNASPVIDGTGATLAIVGESNINIQDIRNFRSLFGLPANDPQIIVDGLDPGIVSGDETESDLDLEWSGAIAKGAAIKFVTSASTNTTSGVDLSALYIVDNDIAPILSESYGQCELNLGAAGNQFIQNLWQQAAAQGISVIVSSGDEGSAACDRDTTNIPLAASHGLTVSGVASTPYNVAVGGTDFLNFGTSFNFKSPSPYWNTSNDAHHASALGYIPESTWNDTCTNVAFMIVYSQPSTEAACNTGVLDTRITPDGGGGGSSNCSTITSGTCSAGYAKPSWQVAPGVPNDGARDLPDVSLFASPGFMDTAFIICEGDQMPNGQACDVNAPYADFLAVGGTSASAPAFAGMMALVNQFTASNGQGNPNYILYRLASQLSQAALNCNATSVSDATCIFNDITFGTIATACTVHSPDCVVNTIGDQYGVLSGYNAGSGYDLATGLGSVNAYQLVHNWGSITGSSTSTSTALLLNNGNTVSITHGDSVPFAITVTPQVAATAPPTGTVALFARSQQAVNDGSFTLAASGSAASATGATTLLSGGMQSIHAHYSGDGTFAPSDSAPINVTVNPEPSTTSVAVLGQSASTIVPVTTSVFGSPVYLNIQSATARTGTSVVDETPTGTVSISDTLNGSPVSVPGSPFSLNSKGTVLSAAILSLATGNHSLIATYSGDSSFQPSVSATSALSIVRAQTILTVGNITVAVLPGDTFINTATIVTSAGLNPVTQKFANIPTPTGTVTFYVDSATFGTPVMVDGGLSGTAQTAGGDAMIVVANPQLSLGSHTLTASYSGDANYLPATAPAVPFVVQADFTLAMNPDVPTVTISAPGAASAPITFSITGQPGYNSTINFTSASCSIVPAGSLATCSFSPSSVTGSGSVQLTIQTTGPQSAAIFPLRFPRRPALAGILGSCLTVFIAILLLPVVYLRRALATAAFLFILSGALVFAGCGGGQSTSGTNPTSTATNPGTPTDVTYQVVVTVTGGAITHFTGFNFIVQ